MKLTPAAEAVHRVQEYGKEPDIDGVCLIQLRRFNDASGAMIELMRFHESRMPGLEGFTPAQLNYSIIQPGVTKAFHIHRLQTDVWFVPAEDRVLLVLVDTREGSPTASNTRKIVLGDGHTALIRIPPGVAHGCKNLGPGTARILYLTDQTFDPDPQRCDEGRLPWDFVGPEVWELPKE